MLRFVGIEPLEQKILVIKSTIHYRAAFEPIAKEIIEVDAPGLSSSNLDALRVHARAAAHLPARPGGDVPVRRTAQLRTPARQGGPAMSFPGFSPVRLQGVRHRRASPPRMDAIKTRIRPKLEAVGKELLPDVARIGGGRGLRPCRQARAPHGEPARRHLGGLRAATSAATRSTAISRWRCPAAACAFSSRPGPSTPTRSAGSAAWKRDTPKLVPVLRRAEGPRLVQERARRGRRPPSSRPGCRRVAGSATSSRRSATASSSSAAPSRPPRPRAGHPPTTRAPPARPSSSWRRSTPCPK